MKATFRSEPLTAANWNALEDLFGKSGASNGCWCMWPRMGSAYSRRTREENRSELKRLTESAPSPGVLVFDGDLCVGWSQVAPRRDLAWIAQRKQFGPVDDEPVWAIGCFVVRREYRAQGVSSVLIEAAVEHARKAGAAILEAYPVDTDVPGHTRNLFMGVASTFARQGFEVVLRRRADRPVMRKELRSAPGGAH